MMLDQNRVQLRDTIEADLPIFFEQQSDPEGMYMVAFTMEDATDPAIFQERWTKALADETRSSKTILFDGQIAGNVVSFIYNDNLTVGYWLGKAFWGKGIATEALRQFITTLPTRPIYAMVAQDNIGSRRVLEKCGFVICGEDKAFARARGAEIEEFILRLDGVTLRPMTEADLPILFEQQSDPDGVYMAAFTAKDPSDRTAFDTQWTRLIADDACTTITILFNGAVAGNIGSFLFENEPHVGYWLGKAFWGKGIATEALRQFLQLVTPRPLFARVAKDNLASRRVLEKCGFVISGEDKGFANARGAEIEEFILRLDSPN